MGLRVSTPRLSQFAIAVPQANRASLCCGGLLWFNLACLYLPVFHGKATTAIFDAFSAETLAPTQRGTDQLFQHIGSSWCHNSQLLAVMQSQHNHACQKDEEEQSVTACHASFRITSGQTSVVCQQ